MTKSSTARVYDGATGLYAGVAASIIDKGQENLLPDRPSTSDPVGSDLAHTRAAGPPAPTHMTGKVIHWASKHLG
jgi:hypothetical protein